MATEIISKKLPKPWRDASKSFPPNGQRVLVTSGKFYNGELSVECGEHYSGKDDQGKKYSYWSVDSDEWSYDGKPEITYWAPIKWSLLKDLIEYEKTNKNSVSR